MIAAGQALWGRAARPLWPLMAQGCFLNHGSYGSVAYPVQAARSAWQARLAENPDHFFRDLYPHALRAARGALADFLGCGVDDLVLVENATAGVQTVIEGLVQAGVIAAGRTVQHTSHIYGAVQIILARAARRTGARLDRRRVPITPESNAQILEILTTGWAEAPPALLVVDHLASPTALIFPVAQIVAVARALGVPVLVDGAHAPGMIPCTFDAIMPDFYVGNCHKWLGAPPGTAFIIAAPCWHDHIEPLVASHDAPLGWPHAFDWIGTRDPSAWLCLPDAIGFRRQWDDAAVWAHGADILAAADGLFPALTPIWARGLMGCYDLGPGTPEQAARIWHILRHEHQIEAAIIPFDQRLLLRLSAFIYNDRDDIAALAQCLPAIVKKVLS